MNCEKRRDLQTGFVVLFLGVFVAGIPFIATDEPTPKLRETLRRFAVGTGETRPGDDELLQAAKCQQILGYHADALKTLRLIQWQEAETEISENEKTRRYEISLEKDQLLESLVGPLLDARESGKAALAARSISNDTMRNRKLSEIVRRQIHAARAGTDEREPDMLRKASETAKLLPEEQRKKFGGDIASRHLLDRPEKTLEMFEAGSIGPHSLISFCENARPPFSLEKQALLRKMLDEISPSGRPYVINRMTLYGGEDKIRKLKADPEQWKFLTGLVREAVDILVSQKDSGSIHQYYGIFLYETYRSEMPEENARLLAAYREMIPREKTPWKRADALWSLLGFIQRSRPDDVEQSDEILKRIFDEVVQIPGAENRAGFFWRILSVEKLTDEQFARCADFYREILKDVSEKEYPENVMKILDKPRLDAAKRKEIVLDALRRQLDQPYSSEISQLLRNLVRNDLDVDAEEMVLADWFPEAWRERAYNAMARGMATDYFRPMGSDKVQRILELLEHVKNPEQKYDVLKELVDHKLRARAEKSELPDRSEMLALALKISNPEKRFDRLCSLLFDCRKNKIEIDFKTLADELYRIVEQEKKSQERLDRIWRLLGDHRKKEYLDRAQLENLFKFVEETIYQWDYQRRFRERFRFSACVDWNEIEGEQERQQRREEIIETLLETARYVTEERPKIDAYVSTLNRAVKYALADQARQVAAEGLEYIDSLVINEKNRSLVTEARSRFLNLAQ